MEGERPFVIQTNGNCFLCLKKRSEKGAQIQQNGGGEGGESSFQAVTLLPGGMGVEAGGGGGSSSAPRDHHHSVKPLLRYLNVNMSSVLQQQMTGVPATGLAAFEKSDTRVTLCETCAPASGQISELLEKLDVIRMQLRELVKLVHGRMGEAEGDEERVEEFTKEMLKNPQSVFHFGVVEMLRRETYYKCDALVKETNHSVAVMKMDNPKGTKPKPMCRKRTNNTEASCSSGTIQVVPATSLINNNVEDVSSSSESESNYSSSVGATVGSIVVSTSAPVRIFPSAWNNNATSGINVREEPAAGPSHCNRSSPSTQMDMDDDSFISPSDVVTTVMVKNEPESPVPGPSACNYMDSSDDSDEHMEKDASDSDDDRNASAPPIIITKVVGGGAGDDDVKESSKKKKRYGRKFSSSRSEKMAQRCRCDICGKTLVNKYYLRVHQDTVHNGGRKTAPCLTPKRTFTFSSSLRKDPGPGVPIQDQGVKYKCVLCPLDFNAKKQLLRHLKRDHAGEELACDVCSSIFMSSETLVKHKNTVKGQASCRNQQMMKTCPFCPLKFRFKKSLVLHVKGDHVDKELACGVCSAKFRSLQRIVEHKNTMKGKAACRKRVQDKVRRQEGGELDEEPTSKNSSPVKDEADMY